MKFKGLDTLAVRVDLSGPRASYELIAPLAFDSDAAGRIVVPAGFATDFGSVPRVLEWVVSGEDSQLVPGSIVHDYIYRGGGLVSGRRVSRIDADRLLIEAMADRGAGWAKRNAVWSAIRVGGRYP